MFVTLLLYNFLYKAKVSEYNHHQSLKFGLYLISHTVDCKDFGQEKVKVKSRLAVLIWSRNSQRSLTSTTFY